MSQGNLRMQLGDRGQYEPQRIGDAVIETDLSVYCPFGNAAPDETALAASLFPRTTADDRQIGRYLELFAGHIVADGYRDRGSSGGFGSWLPAQLMAQGAIDAVLHVRRCNSPNKLFSFAVSRTLEDVLDGAKSRYYPVEMAEVIAVIAAEPGRYAVVGLPCFIKAIRLVARGNPDIASRITVTIGLVCGHLKSTRFADFLAWQTGIAPGHLRTIDFRHKLPDHRPMDYAVKISGDTGESNVAEMRSLFGHQWGYGLFKLAACDFCDDVFAETADVTVGDAWVAPYDADPAGTNILVVRTPMVACLLRGAQQAGDVVLDPIDADTMAASQAGGLRHRRQGLAWRLLYKDLAGLWRPRKRVAAATDARGRAARQQRVRMMLRETSHAAFQEALDGHGLAHVLRRLAPLMRRHDRLSRPAHETIMRTRAMRFIVTLIPDVLKRAIKQRIRRA